LKDEIARLKKESRQRSDRLNEVQAESNHRDQVMQRKFKEHEDSLNRMASEIDNLKQERDTYKDRFQRSLRESQT